ncbi:MAG: BrnT family toxin [Treponema sp.]|jgi:uncharacterized DUF497 family protein|nr:BrnT family toxin [Treponema sp.]
MYDDVIYKGRYIWNRLKNEKNKKEHGISFEDASDIFDDLFAVEEYDADNSEYEERYNITGYLEGLSYVTVAFTLRDNLTRIFSSRESDPEERGAYNENVKRHIGYN